MFSRVGPNIPNEHERKLSDELQELKKRRDTLQAIGEDASSFQDEIFSVRRQIRSGGILHDGDTLGDKFVLIEEVGSGGYATV